MWLAAVGPGATILVLAPGLSTRWPGRRPARADHGPIGAIEPISRIFII